MNNRGNGAPAPQPMTNDQLAECIRSHILALRGEMNRRLDDLEKRLDRFEAQIDRLHYVPGKPDEK